MLRILATPDGLAGGGCCTGGCCTGGCCTGGCCTGGCRTGGGGGGDAMPHGCPVFGMAWPNGSM
jgi:hypothetical protein